jgi:hypothetical protein
MKYWFILLLVLVSCKSPTKAIAVNSNEISTIAQSSKEKFELIDEVSKTKDLDVVAIQSLAKDGTEEQKKIITLSKDNLVQVTKVEDKVPWWAELLNTGFIFGIIITVVFLFFYTGLASIVRGLLMNIGLFVPKVKMEQANIVHKAMETDDPVTFREAVAALRASDPAFDAAFKKVSKKEKLK